MASKKKNTIKLTFFFNQKLDLFNSSYEKEKSEMEHLRVRKVIKKLNIKLQINTFLNLNIIS